MSTRILPLPHAPTTSVYRRETTRPRSQPAVLEIRSSESMVVGLRSVVNTRNIGFSTQELRRRATLVLTAVFSRKGALQPGKLGIHGCPDSYPRRCLCTTPRRNCPGLLEVRWTATKSLEELSKR